MNQKLRFKVFSRDNFTCQYCGKKPPQVVLEVDHAISRKDGGEDDIMNLITSCFACNRGKGKESVTSVERTKLLKKETSALKEQKTQLAAYYKFLKEKKKLEDFKMSIYLERWEENSGGEYFLNKMGIGSLKALITNGNSQEDILKAMDIAWEAKNVSPDDKFRYMCGVLKRLKLQKENPELVGEAKRIRTELCKFFKYWNGQDRGSGYLRTRVVTTVEEIIKHKWNFKDIKPYIDETYSQSRGNYSDAFEEILHSSIFYKQ